MSTRLKISAAINKEEPKPTVATPLTTTTTLMPIEEPIKRTAI